MIWLLRALTVVVVLCFAGSAAVLYERRQEAAAPPASLAEGGAETGMPSPETLGQFSPLAAPRPAPAVSFTSRDGKAMTLADFRGRMLLVNLWATWCGPCVKEMPSLQSLQADFGPDLTILAISQDRGGATVVDAFVAKHGLDRLSIYLDPKAEASQVFAVAGLPTSFLIDRDGRILGRLEGAADWTAPKLVALLRRYVTPPATKPATSG